MMGQARNRKAEIEALKEAGKFCSDAGLVSVVVVRNNRCLVAGSMSMIPNIENLSTIPVAGAWLAVETVETPKKQETMFMAAQRFLTSLSGAERLAPGGFYAISIDSDGLDKPAMLSCGKITKESWVALQAL